MGYTPPNSFGAGTVISAADVQENLDAMNKYVDGAVASTDLAVDGWVQSKHIMRGHYNTIVNMHSFVSGLNGGHVADPADMSFIGDGPTGRNNKTNPDLVPFPNSTIDFHLTAAADVMFQFSAYPHTPSVNGLVSPATTFATLFVDGVQALQTQCATNHIIYTNSFQDSDFWIPHYQNVWSGFFISKNLAAGDHTIGIRGTTSGRHSFLTHWSVSLEAFYR